MEPEAYARVAAHRAALIFLEKLLVETGAIPKDTFANLLEKFAIDYKDGPAGRSFVYAEMHEIIDMLRSTTPPSWTPKVIDGGNPD